jgi:hypothetical protein
LPLLLLAQYVLLWALVPTWQECGQWCRFCNPLRSLQLLLLLVTSLLLLVVVLP